MGVSADPGRPLTRGNLTRRVARDNARGLAFTTSWRAPHTQRVICLVSQRAWSPDAPSPAVTSHGALRGIMLGGWRSHVLARAAPRDARDGARGLALTRPDTRRAARCARWCSGVGVHTPWHAPRRALRGMVLGDGRSHALTRAAPRVARDGARGWAFTRHDKLRGPPTPELSYVFSWGPTGMRTGIAKNEPGIPRFKKWTGISGGVATYTGISL